MQNSIKYVASSFIWGSIAKILNAGLKFVSIPLLLNYFGKDSYGLIALAVATNAYMQLLNMGMNTGAVKFFSQWLAIKDYDKIHRIARTNLSLYIGLGLINCILLLVLAWKGGSIFQISLEEFITFRYLLFILAALSVFNWSTFVFNQLLVADEKIAFTQQVLSIRNLMNLAIVLLTIYFKWSIIQYFLYDSLINMLVIVPYYWVSKKRNLIQSVLPGFYWKDFSVVFKYSLAIFAMGIFQFTATKSRPLVLGIFSNQGASILSDYRVIEVFPIFIISLGGMLISILLPKASQAIQRNDRKAIERIAYDGTRYTSILVSFLCYPVILNAAELLKLYVGTEYMGLSIWLILWIVTLLVSLFNSPVSSLVLATGRTKMLVYSTAIASIVSIVINAALCNSYGVGSAVIGYLAYITIQVSFYFFYFNSKIMGLDSFKVFKSFVFPVLIGLGSMLLITVIPITINSLFLTIGLRSVLWGILFIIFLFLFKIVDIQLLFQFIYRSDSD